jgi:tetratricopeptide (TPR) repeat protein
MMPSGSDGPDQLLSRAESSLRNGTLPEAEAASREALARWPDHPGAMALRGAVLIAQGDAAAALPLLRAATSIPGVPALWFLHLRDACLALFLFDEAASAARLALRRAPDDPKVLAAYGIALAMAGDLTAARIILTEALRQIPDDVPARLGHAHALLAAGRWEQGWPEYEWRLQALAQNLPPFPGRPWGGETLPGETIGLISEQGFGDALHFARYVALVAQRCGGIVIACQAGLVPLFRGLPGVTQCVSKVSMMPPVAAHITFGSLPRIFGTSLVNVPASTSYLSADHGRRAAWQARLGEGRSVGLFWAGNPANPVDRRRSLALSMVQPLLAIPGIRFVSLQKDIAEPDRAVIAAAGVLDLSDALTDFGETAPAISCLDLVITVDSAVAHLAGALGRPVWLMLMEPADWRWLQNRNDTPWYPTARLFRQQRAGEWGHVMQAVEAALVRWQLEMANG